MANRRYETLVLIHPDQGDAGSKDLVGRIRQLIEGQGGSIAQVQEWGLRDLAYPIARQRRAFHVLFEYHASPQALAEVERNLKLIESVVRHLSVRRAENAPLAAPRPAQGSEALASRRAFETGSGEDVVEVEDGDVVMTEGEGV
jgi:small subunit ribosomal protein S6